LSPTYWCSSFWPTSSEVRVRDGHIICWHWADISFVFGKWMVRIVFSWHILLRCLKYMFEQWCIACVSISSILAESHIFSSWLSSSSRHKIKLFFMNLTSINDQNSENLHCNTMIWKSFWTNLPLRILTVFFIFSLMQSLMQKVLSSATKKLLTVLHNVMWMWSHSMAGRHIRWRSSRFFLSLRVK